MTLLVLMSFASVTPPLARPHSCPLKFWLREAYISQVYLIKPLKYIQDARGASLVALIHASTQASLPSIGQGNLCNRCLYRGCGGTRKTKLVKVMLRKSLLARVWAETWDIKKVIDLFNFLGKLSALQYTSLMLKSVKILVLVMVKSLSDLTLLRMIPKGYGVNFRLDYLPASVLDKECPV